MSDVKDLIETTTNAKYLWLKTVRNAQDLVQVIQALIIEASTHDKLIVVVYGERTYE